MNFYRNILFIFIGTFFSFSAFGQEANFTSKVSKTRLGINERIRVSFEINQNGDNFNPPSFEGFQIVGGPNQSVSQSWVNGKQSFSKSYTYFLRPTQKGKLTIGAAQINVKKETYKTKPISVEVTDAVDNPSQGKKTETVVEGKIHLVREISNTSPYINEGISILYKLYFNQDLRITNFNELKSPNYNDFWNQVINIAQYEVKQEKFKGENYSYIVLKKLVLYPQKVKKITLDPLEINLILEVPSMNPGLFPIQMYDRIDKLLTTDTQYINVKPLPEANKPTNFNGAVGDFSFDVVPNKTALKKGDDFQVKVKVNGNGNLKLLSLPELSVPNSLEIYDPEYSDNTNTSLRGMTGSIENNYTIIANNEGKFPLPVLQFSYFNPKSKKYITLNSKEINIDVQQNNVALEATNTTQKVVSANINNFHFIKTKTHLVNSQPKKLWKSNLFYVLTGSPLLLMLLFFFILKKKEEYSNSDGLAQKRQKRLVRKYLKTAQKELRGSKEKFYQLLEQALYNFIKTKLKITITEFNKEYVKKLLEEKNVNPQIISELISLLERCQASIYSPLTSNSVMDDYEKAVEIISKIDR